MSVILQSDDEMEMEQLSGREHEEEPKELEAGVHIKNLTKIYDKVYKEKRTLDCSYFLCCQGSRQWWRYSRWYRQTGTIQLMNNRISVVFSDIMWFLEELF